MQLTRYYELLEISSEYGGKKPLSIENIKCEVRNKTYANVLIKSKCNMLYIVEHKLNKLVY